MPRFLPATKAEIKRQAKFRPEIDPDYITLMQDASEGTRQTIKKSQTTV